MRIIIATSSSRYKEWERNPSPLLYTDMEKLLYSDLNLLSMYKTEF